MQSVPTINVLLSSIGDYNDLPLVEQELLTLSELIWVYNSPSVFGGVHVAMFLVLGY
jgi:hypothetical protein